MDGAGGGWQGVGDGRGWQGSRDGTRGGEDDQGRCVDGSASSDAFYGHSGAGGELQDAERLPPAAFYYGTTNNNDYSKYATTGGFEVSGGGGGVHTSDYLPHSAAYDALRDNSGDHIPGGCYARESSLGCDSLQEERGYGRDYVTPGGSDQRCRGRRRECSDYGSLPKQCYSDRVGSSACSDQCDEYSECHRRQHEYTPSTVQVTAKVLFGSVSAISNLKQSKKTTKKK
ncbi:uncharacterized protein [Procambarus clarkii]|uniref:uncharacterized protein n=1 Tax=Procambarus clarkii TaxID=6728 RepID=UPI001E671AE1|nr:uncharacterized protein LOC123751158 [Procambarus clarkii]